MLSTLLLLSFKLEAPLVHRRLRRRRLFLGGQGGLPVADYCPLTRGGGSCHIRTCVCIHLFTIPLHGACRCSRGEQRISFLHTGPNSVLNHCGSYWGNPISCCPNPSNKEKKRRKIHPRAGLATLPSSPGPPLRTCPRSHLPFLTTP